MTARIVFFGIACLLIPAAAVGQSLEASIDRGHEELDVLRERLATVEKELSALSETVSDAEDELATLEVALRVARELRDGTAEQLDRLQRDVSARSDTLRVARARLEETRFRLARHVRQIFARGKPDLVTVLFGGGDVPATVRRVQYVTAVLGAERTLMDELDRRGARLAAALDALEHRERELQQLLDGRDAEQRRLNRLETEQRVAVTRLQNQITDRETLRDAMEQSAKELERTIARLEREIEEGRRRPPFAGGAPLTAAKGRLAWPVEGGLIGTFGKRRHERYKTSTFNPGIDIQADAGTPIRAIAPGQVEFVDWVKGYGKTIILGHGNGYYSLYAHASEVLVSAGDRVDDGAVIARVGATDSLYGSGLHFELRQGGNALDPLKWLVNR